MEIKRLTPEQIRTAEGILQKGDRVELIPIKDGVKLLRVRREVMGKNPGKPAKKP